MNLMIIVKRLLSLSKGVKLTEETYPHSGYDTIWKNQICRIDGSKVWGTDSPYYLVSVLTYFVSFLSFTFFRNIFLVKCLDFNKLTHPFVLPLLLKNRRDPQFFIRFTYVIYLSRNISRHVFILERVHQDVKDFPTSRSK